MSRPIAPLGKFELRVSAQTGAGYCGFLRRQLRIAHGLLRSPVRELSVVLVGDRQMSILHRRFMKIDGPTDVLTFPLETLSRGRAVSGEVVVCVGEARRAAKEHGVAVREELLLYALHGMLHLSGLNDRTDREFVRMHRTEDAILTQLGIGPVFSRSIPPAPPTAPPSLLLKSKSKPRGRE